jgi:methyl-accepting chemotaxis protein
MFDNWSFGRKLAAGFATVVALTLLTAAFAVYTLKDVVRTYEGALEQSQRSLNNSMRLDTYVENHIAASRAYLLTRQQRFLDEKAQLQTDVERLLGTMRQGSTGPADLAAIDRAWAEYLPASREQQRYASDQITHERMTFAVDELRPFRQALRAAVDTLVESKERSIADVTAKSSVQVRTATATLAIASVLATLLAILLATLLTRLLGRQVGSAVAQIQSSSTELQAAAGQQVSGLREQSTAMTEVTTTMNELLTTSRQIAESARQVSILAGDTASGAKTGDSAVERSKAAIAAISKQVEQIVTFMLELGRKSQQIGLVLDLVSELAEQTNILAINATIEATGAGDAGRRFLVVADEIRKLADRVTVSMKEVRTLVEDVRGAVSTTVMATETGAKAVDAGSRQFEELTRVFTQIVELVKFTTEAAREIELSTKQQASAVEQVNIAVASVAQATREGESSSTQTLQTAVQLSTLSKDLVQLVRAGAAN